MALVHPSRLVPLALAAGALVGLSGCGRPAPTDVSGTIKLRGQAPKFTGIQVVFLHPDGTMVTAPVGADGIYKAEGVPAGEVKVSFAYLTPDSVQQGVEFKAGGPRLKKPGDKAGPEAPKPKAVGTPGPAASLIPAALRDGSTSNLTFTVEAGKSNVFDYDIGP